MSLFKKLLFNIFPSNFQTWPDGKMFLSLVSARDFFSMVIKKSIENYKINNFDIALDSFDIKIWIWEEISIKSKDIEFYYSYTSAAHYNGYRFLSINNIATNISMIAWRQNRKSFAKWEHLVYVNYIISVYLMCYVFGSGIKSFPNFTAKDEYELKNMRYKRFLSVFFNFLDMIMDESQVKIKPQRYVQIKEELTMNLQMFFALFYTVSKLNANVLRIDESWNDGYFSRLLTQKSTLDIASITEYINNYKSYIYSDSRQAVDKIAVSIVCPYDIHIKYLYNQDAAFDINDNIIDKIFNSSAINDYLDSFLISDEKLEDFILHITDVKNIKDKFFLWMWDYIRKQDTISNDREDENDEDESFLATENMISKLEQDIKNQIFKTQWIIDFYIKYMWSLWIARWDSFQNKFFRSKLSSQIYNSINNIKNSSSELPTYASDYQNKLANIYTKNDFYYDSMFDSLRYQKTKTIKIPLAINKTYSIETQSIIDNIYISGIASFLQDINIRDTKVHTNNKKILAKFQEDFANKIIKLVNSESNELIRYVYWPFADIVDWPIKSDNTDNISISQIINQNIYISDISRLKDSLYILDLHIWRDVGEMMRDNMSLYDQYDGHQLLHIFACLRDTIFGILLLIKYLQLLSQKSKIDLMINDVVDFYISEVLMIQDKLVMNSIIMDILAKYSDYLQLRTSMDENEKYLKVFHDSWSKHLYNIYNDLDAKIYDEDIIRFRGYLRNITYYNKRILI